MTGTIPRLIFIAAGVLSLTGPGLTAGSPVISTRQNVCSGHNFDMDIRDGTIHLISDDYYELDLDGSVTYKNADISDGQQRNLDFGPALDVGRDGTVHIITRNGGDSGSGYNLKYSSRDNTGTWKTDMQSLGSPVARNYVVEVAGLDDGTAVYAHSRLENGTGSNVNGRIYFYGLDGSTVTPLGKTTVEQLYRIDCDYRFDSSGDTIYAASGYVGTNGKTHYMKAVRSSNLAADLQNSRSSYGPGSGRKGFPDISIDGAGKASLTMGGSQTVYFRKMAPDGTTLKDNTLLLSGLGDWHLGTGLSAVAVSDDGSTILAAALKTDGTKDAGSSTIHYTWSGDGGKTWSAPEQLGDFTTSAGEGRSRPRLKYYDNAFYLFFNDNDGGISLAVFSFAPPAAMVSEGTEIPVRNMPGYPNPVTRGQTIIFDHTEHLQAISLSDPGGSVMGEAALHLHSVPSLPTDNLDPGVHILQLTFRDGTRLCRKLFIR